MVCNRSHAVLATLAAAALLLPASATFGSRRAGVGSAMIRPNPRITITRPATERPLLPVIRDRHEQERQDFQQDAQRRLQRAFDSRASQEEIFRLRQELAREEFELRRRQREEQRILQRSQPPRIHTGPSAFPRISPIVIEVRPMLSGPPRDGLHSRRF